MNYRLALPAVVCVTLVNLSPLQAQERQLEATGTGSMTAGGETVNAVFELWGNDGQTSLIKIDAPDNEIRFSQITMTSYSADGSSASGNYVPCDGGRCLCELRGDGAGTALMAVCTSEANPDYGQLHISISNITRR